MIRFRRAELDLETLDSHGHAQHHRLTI